MNRMAKQLCVLALAVVVASGCASAPDPTFGEDVPNEIALIVVNDYRTTMSVFVQWLQGSPIHLGEIASGAAQVLPIPVRGQEARVLFVSLGRAPGDPQEPRYLPVRAGDRFEWRLRADRLILSRRLDE